MLKVMFMVLSFCFFGVLDTWAKVKIDEISLSENNGEAEFLIKYSGALSLAPALMVRDSIVQVELSDAVVWPRINKAFGDKTLLAYQYDKDLARVRALLKYSLAGHEDQVKIHTQNQTVKVTFPTSVIPKRDVTLPKNVSVDQLDEAFLAKVLNEEGKKEKSQEREETNPKKLVTEKNVIEDKIETSFSAIQKPESSLENFSLLGQVGKFAGYLGLILVGLYGLVWISRKGMFSRGKFSFLSNMKAVSVMNRIPLGHKRDLLLIKVGEEVLLLGSTDHSITLITKVEESSQMMKDTELAIAGSNFDTQFETAKVQDKEMKLKVDPLEKLKDKVKHLRPLQ